MVEANLEFRRFLENEEKREAFHTFLQQEHSDENFQFWLQCKIFKESKGPASVNFISKAIYFDFICDSGTFEVNLQQKTKSNIKEGLKSPSRTMFDDAVSEVERLMKFDSYRRYIQSAVAEKQKQNIFTSCMVKCCD